jgi:dihydroorotate dehydrogenase electron transfer subunit
MFDVHGEGTKQLARKQKDDIIDILGPLGNGFDLSGYYSTALIVAGGIGIAPFPFLIQQISDDKKVICFFGGRSRQNIIEYGMKNLLISTDDGSAGFKGNVVQLIESEFEKFKNETVRIFACGPNPMLKALQKFSLKNNIDCQISTECVMACGFGICQGCPIENAEGNGYYLVCKDGPVFDAKTVKL